MLFSIAYLVLFLAAGLGLARRAVPDGARMYQRVRHVLAAGAAGAGQRR